MAAKQYDGHPNAFTQAELEAFETEHERIGYVHHSGGAFSYVFKKAPRLVWKQFRAQIADVSKLADAQEQILKATVIAVKRRGRVAVGAKEAREEFDALLEDFTGAADGADITRRIQAVNGAAEAAEGN